MNSMLNNACISALLCGAVIVAVPAFSQTAGSAENTATGTVNTATATNPPRSFAQNNTSTNAGAKAGASVSTGGVSATGDVNNADASNNAASVNRSTQSSTSAGASVH